MSEGSVDAVVVREESHLVDLNAVGMVYNGLLSGSGLL